jgi:hypothetical protein
VIGDELVERGLELLDGHRGVNGRHAQNKIELVQDLRR